MPIPMIILEPIAHPTIWGGKNLCRYFDEPYEKIGHMYSLYDNDVSNKILNGEFMGKTIHDWFLRNKEKYSFQHFSAFPIVLAVVEATDSLSIQVHPDDTCAQKTENASWGKNESWYFLNAPESGWIYAGCKVTDKTEISNMIAKGLGSEIAGKLPIRAGDYVYVEAGTLHAMTKGSFVYEIEENSEYTYRLYDFNRIDANGNKRELHLDKALAALKPEKMPTVRHYEGKEITERLYTTSLIENVNQYINQSETLECITLLFDLDDTVEGVQLCYGMTIVLEPGDLLPVRCVRAMMARLKLEGIQ